MGAVRPEDVMKVLAITDSFNLHRESVFIPLATEDVGSVALQSDGRLRVVCPSTGAFENWLKELRMQLEKMDLSKLRMH